MKIIEEKEQPKKFVALINNITNENKKPLLIEQKIDFPISMCDSILIELVRKAFPILVAYDLVMAGPHYEHDISDCDRFGCGEVESKMTTSSINSTGKVLPLTKQKNFMISQDFGLPVSK